MREDSTLAGRVISRPETSCRGRGVVISRELWPPLMWRGGVCKANPCRRARYWLWRRTARFLESLRVPFREAFDAVTWAWPWLGGDLRFAEWPLSPSWPEGPLARPLGPFMQKASRGCL